MLCADEVDGDKATTAQDYCPRAARAGKYRRSARLLLARQDALVRVASLGWSVVAGDRFGYICRLSQ
jgi:hypothetical protein